MKLLFVQAVVVQDEKINNLGIGYYQHGSNYQSLGGGNICSYVNDTPQLAAGLFFDVQFGIL